MNKDNLIYDFMNEKMKEHADVSPNQISYKKARYVLSRFNIPSWLWMPVLKEMMNTGYLKRESQQAISISDKEVDLDRVQKNIDLDSLNPNRSARCFKEYKERKIIN